MTEAQQTEIQEIKVLSKKDLGNAQNILLEKPAYINIFLAIFKLDCSYPSEIAKETGIDDSTVSRSVYEMIQLGILKKIPMPEDYVNPILLRRLPDLWLKGNRGYAKISKLNVVTLSTPDVGGERTVKYFIDLIIAIQEEHDHLRPTIEAICKHKLRKNKRFVGGQNDKNK